MPFLSTEFFGGMLGIKLGAARSGSKDTNHCAMLPPTPLGGLYVRVLVCKGCRQQRQPH